MDMEEIENNLEEVKSFERSGFMDKKHFEEYRYSVSQGMLEFGGAFFQALAIALDKADPKNALKILRYWQADCEQASMMYRMTVARNKAETF